MSAVDVIMPNYNYGRFLGDAIESALAQEGVDVRVVVVDNASTDDSVEIVERIMARDNRLHLIKHETNLGLIRSLNDGVDWCSADYLVNLSADDRLTRGSLHRAAAALDAEPDAAFVYGPVQVYKQGTRRGRPFQPLSARRRWSGGDWLWQAAGSGHVCIRSPEVVMRTKLVKECGFAPELPHASDIGLCLRLAARGSVVHLRGAKQAIYRVHPSSLMHMINNPVVTDLHSRLEAFELLTDADRELLQAPDALLDRARSALALEAVELAAGVLDADSRQTKRAEELVGAACDIWPAVALSPTFKEFDKARFGSGSFQRWLRRSRRGARWCVQFIRVRQLGQWPNYVSH
jgi:hypothetical protein